MAHGLQSGLRDGGLSRGGLHAGLGNGSIFNIASLDLNFAKYKNIGSLVTFTRASSGTFVGSDGVLQSAVTNLQRYSEDFTQGLTPTNATLTVNQGVAPNGTLTADAFLETAVNGLHSQEIVDHTFVASVTYTFSCYAKSIGGRNFGPGFPTLFSSARFGFFNLSGSGSVVSTDAGVTASIQAVGDGWYRCSITSICITGGGARVGVFIASGTSISYAGDITKGLLLWGAQLEQSTTVGEYIPTTSTINSAPRFDHNPTTGESLGLLVEEQRSNLLLQSENFGTTWTANGLLAFGSGSTLNALAAPDGQTTADLITENTSNSQHNVNQISTTTGAKRLSVFAKQGSGARLLRLIDFNATDGAQGETYFNLSTGAVVSGPGTIQAFPNGWYRCSIQSTTTVTSTYFISIATSASAFTYTGDGTSGIYIWGAQLEAGAFPTSYIPTTTAAATRSADVASITGSAFSGFYRQDEGTLYSQFIIGQDSDGNRFFAGLFDANATNGTDIRSDSISVIRGVSASSGSQVANLSVTGLSIGAQIRASVAYKVNDFGFSANGATPVIDSLGAVGVSVDRLTIGSFKGEGNFVNTTLSRIVFWPTRLSNATLQSITQ